MFDLRHDIFDIEEHITDRGIRLEIGEDFSVFNRAIREQPLRHNVAPQFHVDTGELDDAFWILGWDKYGVLVHTQAYQKVDLLGGSLADYIKRNSDHYVPRNPPVDFSSVQCIPGPRARKITGDVVYQGELWINRKSPYVQLDGIVALLNRYGYYLAMDRWDSDVIFGLMSWGMACDGLAHRIGYLHSEPAAVTWKRKNSNRHHQVWTVYMEREDLEFLRFLPPEEMASEIKIGFFNS